MTIIHRLYETTAQAERAVAMLQAAGVPDEQLSLIAGAPERDSHTERAGGFADGDGHAHDAHREPVGSFAAGDGHTHDAHREPVGSFAAGDGHQARVGGFADVDRDSVTMFGAGMRRVSPSGHPQIVRMLVAAGLDHAAAEAQLAAIHQGKAIVLVQTEPGDLDRLNGILATR
jgi:hypothetical protein